MDVLMLSGIAIIAIAMCSTLKQHGGQYAVVVSVISGALMLFIIIFNMAPIINQIKNLINYAKIPGEYTSVLFKSLGICLIAQFTADACHDAGENAIASKVELGAKVAVLISALPLFEKITQTAIEFIGAR